MKNVDILVADDHAVVREGLRALIEVQPGWRVVGEASTGLEAVEMAQELRPHIVVMDFSMPGLNGLEATRKICHLLPGTEVLVLTMHDSNRLAQHLFAAGASGFVLKNDARSQLVAALTHLADHQAYVAPTPSGILPCDYPRTADSLPPEYNMRTRLTARETEVLQLIVEGRNSKAIALLLGVREKTVESHRTNLMRKLDIHSVAALVRYALLKNMVEN